METEFLIVGAGFGGLETAIQLRKSSPQAAITLASPQPYLVYKPWLVYVPAQRKQFEQCLIPLDPLAKQFGLQLILETVTAITPEAHQAQLASGAIISYTQAVIATGSTARREAI